MRTVTEGKAVIRAPADEKISKDLDVFYNPVMQTNRDLSILLLLARGKQRLRIADPLAGSGIRTLRFLNELPEGMIEHVWVNDYKEHFEETFRENAKLSSTSTDEVVVSKREASKFLLENKAFDYIDIDPFGSPNEFLDAAVKRTRRGGILAVTATDTAPLCGTYPKACMRKYWAKPRRDFLMHEYGLRILIRKCQLIGAPFDQALTPVLSYSKDHYFRIFFEVQEGKAKVDILLRQHATIDDYGPLWIGPLWDIPTLEQMAAIADKRQPHQAAFLLTLLREARAGSNVGFHDAHVLARKLRLGGPPRLEKIMEKLQEQKIQAARTHFSPLGIRADCDEHTIMGIMKELSQ